MTARYKITATIRKTGGLSVHQWTRYSDRELTRQECEKMLAVPNEPGRSAGDEICLENFGCKIMRKNKPE